MLDECPVCGFPEVVPTSTCWVCRECGESPCYGGKA